MTVAIMKMTAKNQVTIPVVLVKRLGIKKGDSLVAKMDGDRIILERAVEDWDVFQGILADHPISKKYSAVEIVKMARNAKAKLERKKWIS